MQPDNLEQFLKHNYKEPTAPDDEFEQIMCKINSIQLPWYKKFNFAQYFLIPSMTFALLVLLFFAIHLPTNSTKPELTYQFIQESFAIFEDTDDFKI